MQPHIQRSKPFECRDQSHLNAVGTCHDPNIASYDRSLDRCEAILIQVTKLITIHKGD